MPSFIHEPSVITQFPRHYTGLITVANNSLLQVNGTELHNLGLHARTRGAGYDVAFLVNGRYSAGTGFSNRRTRHPTEDLPWWGVSDKAWARRADGRGDPGISWRFIRGGSGMKPPIVVTCFCGADNRVEIAGLSV